MEKRTLFIISFLFLNILLHAQKMIVWDEGENIYTHPLTQLDSITFFDEDKHVSIIPNGYNFNNKIAGQTYISYYKPKTSSSSSVVEPYYPLYYLYIYDDKNGCLLYYGTTAGQTDQFVYNFTYELNYPNFEATTEDGESLIGKVAGNTGIMLKIRNLYYPFILSHP